MYHLTTLKNDFKVITYPMPRSHGVTCAILVGAGSRYEPDRWAGLSHFAEHMFFKGTPKRPSQADISQAIEGIGGHMNAATSQDYTFYYNQVPARHFKRSIDVLADSFNNALFNADAIEREKGVILEEMNMYFDTPMQYIYDLLMQTVWPDNSLGRDIIGYKKVIQQATRDDFINYLKQTYRPSNSVFVAAGRVTHKQVVSQAKKYFGTIANNHQALKFKKVSASQKKPRLNLHYKKTDQVHLALAVPAIKRGDKDEAALAILNVILGGGMSSRLFLNIREDKGLCYFINSFTEKFEETGIFGIRAGLNLAKLDLALKEILGELDRIKKEPPAPKELKRAKEFLRGTVSLNMDDTDNMALWYGFQALHYKDIKTPKQRITELLQVTESDILRVARKLFKKEKLNLAIIGPLKVSQKAKFSRILHKFK